MRFKGKVTFQTTILCSNLFVSLMLNSSKLSFKVILQRRREQFMTILSRSQMRSSAQGAKHIALIIFRTAVVAINFQEHVVLTT